MMGFFKPCNKTRLICSSILRRLAILSDSQSSKLSAQSPPCSRNCSPRCAWANFARSASISQDTTNGGSRLNEATARSSAWLSGYFGCWVAGRLCQLAGCQCVKAGLCDIRDASVFDPPASKYVVLGLQLADNQSLAGAGLKRHQPGNLVRQSRLEGADRRRDH